jgi:hypothetical protein
MFVLFLRLSIYKLPLPSFSTFRHLHSPITKSLKDICSQKL